MSAYQTESMVEFELSEEQDMLVGLAKIFADEELIPNAEEWDRYGIFPEEAISKARELGLLNCTCLLYTSPSPRDLH